MPATIRPATPGDVPAILPMVAAICALHESWDPDKYPFLPDIVERYEHWLPLRAQDPRSVFLIAELANTPVGYLIATIEDEIPIYRLKQFGFIHDMWVEPAHRGQGIARHLVDAAVARFAELEITQVRLDTAAANDIARRLFASCGFRVSTTEMLRLIE